jgi:hypothetical protein
MDEQIIKLFADQKEEMSLLSEQIIGLSAAHQIVIEILLSHSPQQKTAVAQVLSRLLSHPELTPNEYCTEHLRIIQEIAQSPSPPSPELSSEKMHVVNDQNHPSLRLI